MKKIETGPREEGFRYLQLADEIDNNIANGVYRAGEKLPSIRKLQTQTGFSVTTVYQAFIELERRGRVEPRERSGYFVKPQIRRILPAPVQKKHPLRPKRVSVNAVAGSIVKAMGDPSFLQLGGTLTAPELLPVKQLKRCFRSVAAASLDTAIVTYENPYGNLRLRRQIAKRSLDLFSGADPDDMVITNGCIEAVSLCLQAVAGPGDTVVVESPTYPWFLQIIEDFKMLALELPTDPTSGIDLSALEKALDENDVKACLLVPNFHNPLGFAMSDEKKKALVALTNRRGIPVIEDDIHGELYFGTVRPRTLKFYDRKGLVLYCSSFSKMLAPGLRIGWTLPGTFLKTVRRLKLNLTIAAPALTQLAVAEYLNTGAFDRHLRRLRTALRNQVANTAMAIGRHFPEGTRMTAPEGGLAIWVELDGSVDSMNVFQASLEQKIAILPGFVCSTTDQYIHCIRISCGFPWSRSVERGISVLGCIAGKMAGDGRSGKTMNSP